MFTGLVEAVGVVDAVRSTDAGLELTITSPYPDLARGESVAVSGVCLTVRDVAGNTFTTAAVTTTLERTAIGGWRAGTRVNLERAMRADARLGGHIVQGHVDGVGTVREVLEEGDALLIDITVPSDIDELVVPLGSIALDGVSLTVNSLPSTGTVQVSIIDYTRKHTTLGDLRPGAQVHLEADVLAKYARRMATPYR